MTGREEVKPAREAEQRGEGSLWKRMQVLASEPAVQKGAPREGGGGTGDAAEQGFCWAPARRATGTATGAPARHCHSADQPPPRGGSGPGVFLLLGTNSLPPLFSCSPLRPASSAWQLILQMLPPSVQSTGFEGKVKLSELHQGLGS